LSAYIFPVRFDQRKLSDDIQGCRPGHEAACLAADATIRITP